MTLTLAGKPFQLTHEHPDIWTVFKPKGLHECAKCFCDINQMDNKTVYPVVYDFTNDYGQYVWPKGSAVHVCERCYRKENDMSYDVKLKAKLEGIDKYIVVADVGGTTWNVKELIKQASGWNIQNEANNGTAAFIGKEALKGIIELENNPEKYIEYEAPNGWGTVEGTLRFFRKLHEACMEHPYAYVFVS